MTAVGFLNQAMSDDDLGVRRSNPMTSQEHAQSAGSEPRGTSRNGPRTPEAAAPAGSTADSQAELRGRWIKMFRAHDRAVERVGEEAAAAQQDFAPFADLLCGARAKTTGQPCRRRDLFANGRCRLHGGPSTGPRTAAGKARSAANGRLVDRGDCGEATSRADGDALAVVSMLAGGTEPLKGGAATVRLADARVAVAPSAPRVLRLEDVRVLLESERSRSWRIAEIARSLGCTEVVTLSALKLLRTMGRVLGTEPDEAGVPTRWRAKPEPVGAPAARNVDALAQAAVNAMCAAGMPPSMINARDRRLREALMAGARPEDFAAHVPRALAEAQDPVAFVVGAVMGALARSTEPGLPLRQAFPPVNPVPRWPHGGAGEGSG